MASKRRKKRKGYAAARMTLEGVGLLTAKGRGKVARWLRAQADHLMRHGDDYPAGRVRAGFQLV